MCHVPHCLAAQMQVVASTSEYQGKPGPLKNQFYQVDTSKCGSRPSPSPGHPAALCALSPAVSSKHHQHEPHVLFLAWRCACAVCADQCQTQLSTPAPAADCPPKWTRDGDQCRAPCPEGWELKKGRCQRTACGPEEEQSGLLCYPRCKDGYTGAGPACWRHCPSGWTTLLFLCM